MNGREKDRGKGERWGRPEKKAGKLDIKGGRLKHSHKC